MAALVEGLQFVSDPVAFCQSQNANHYRAIYFVKGEFSPEWDPLTAEKTRFNPLEWLPAPTSVCAAYLQFLYGQQEFGEDKFRRINIYTGPGPSLYFFRAVPESFGGIHDPGLRDHLLSFLSAKDAFKARTVTQAFKKFGHQEMCSSFVMHFTPQPVAAPPGYVSKHLDVAGLINKYDRILKGLKNECSDGHLRALYVDFDDGKTEMEEIHTSRNQMEFASEVGSWQALHDLLTITDTLVFVQYYMDTDTIVVLENLLSSNPGLQIVIQTLILAWDVLDPLQYRDRIFVDLALHPEPSPGMARFEESLQNIAAEEAELRPVSVSIEGEEYIWSNRAGGYVPTEEE
jgi:hypothetical protein